MDKGTDHKEESYHLEESAGPDSNDVNKLSGFEALGAIDTLKRFKFASFVCILVTFSAASDGYQVSCVVCEVTRTIPD
jgi:hypothetical protein